MHNKIKNGNRIPFLKKDVKHFLKSEHYLERNWGAFEGVVNAHEMGTRRRIAEKLIKN